MPFNVEHPLAYHGTLSAAMSACLYLFVTVMRDMERLRRRVDLRQTEIERDRKSVV